MPPFDGADQEDDIGADVAAALRELEGDAPAPAAPAPAPAAPAAAPAAEGRSRDGQGRFADKTTPAAAPAGEASAAPITDQPVGTGTEAPGEPIRPPASWSPEAKSLFSTLPPVLQAEIGKREKDMERGIGERATQLKRYEPLEAILSPHRERIALAGLDDASYIRALITADEMLRGPNRDQAFAHLGRQYGINLQQPAQPGQQQQPQAQLPPVVQQMLDKISTLESTLAQQSSTQEQSHRDQNLSAIQAFAADPKNVYFENVRKDMADLIQGGRASSMDQAYEMAIWARSDIRPLLLKAQESAAAAQVQEQARARTSQARQAAGSISGAPTPGASPAAGALNSNTSVEDDVRAAVESLRSA